MPAHSSALPGDASPCAHFTVYRHFATTYPPKPAAHRVRVCGVLCRFWVCYSASIENKRKGAQEVAVKELQILAIVALVTGFVWGAIGIIGQDAGLVQLSAIVACVGMFAAVLSVLFIEE